MVHLTQPQTLSSIAGELQRVAAGASVKSMLEVSDEAKDAKLASRIPLMQTAAALGSLGTPAAHAPVINELIAKSSQSLGATVKLEETRRDRLQGASCVCVRVCSLVLDARPLIPHHRFYRLAPFRRGPDADPDAVPTPTSIPRQRRSHADADPTPTPTPIPRGQHER